VSGKGEGSWLSDYAVYFGSMRLDAGDVVTCEAISTSNPNTASLAGNNFVTGKMLTYNLVWKMFKIA
jgi:hypothetical protein